jgi:hypothetical protein
VSTSALLRSGPFRRHGPGATALATLTAAGPDSEPLAGAVDEVTVEGDRVEVRWAADGSRTGVTFDPVTVHRTAGREPEPGP